MGKFALAAALLAAASLQVASATRQCSISDREAEQALIFQTNLMVVSSACRDLTYAQFRYRNKDAIIAYQRAMITHFRRAGYRNAQAEFDRWNTSLANQIALKQGQMPTAQVCQQAAPMLQMASTLDRQGLPRLRRRPCGKARPRWVRVVPLTSSTRCRRRGAALPALRGLNVESGLRTGRDRASRPRLPALTEH